jgi:hypothetical protein
MTIAWIFAVLARVERFFVRGSTDLMIKFRSIGGVKSKKWLSDCARRRLTESDFRGLAFFDTPVSVHRVISCFSFASHQKIGFAKVRGCWSKTANAAVKNWQARRYRCRASNSSVVESSNGIVFWSGGGLVPSHIVLAPPLGKGALTCNLLSQPMIDC